MTTNLAWQLLLSDILTSGREVKPREFTTLELLAHRTVVPMENPVVTLGARRLGYRFLCAEAAWILSGDNRVSTIAPYSRHISQFSDDGERFFGAYGPKVVEQLSYAAACLKDDPSSRQAVINLWREQPRKTKDVPCTLSLQFMVRNHQLDCVATMRSSDAWLGWVYDVFNFSMIAAALLIELRGMWGFVPLGDLYLTAGSQHLYKRDWELARDAASDASPAFEVASLDVSEFKSKDDLVNHLWTLADYGRDGPLLKRSLTHRWLAELPHLQEAMA